MADQKSNEMNDEQATKMFQDKTFPALSKETFDAAAMGVQTGERLGIRNATVYVADAFGVFADQRDALAAGAIELPVVVRAAQERVLAASRAAVRLRLEQCVLDLLPLVEGSDIDTNESPELVWPRLVARLKEAASRASLPGVRS